MYIKRILIAVALIGLIALGGFSFFVYNAVFRQTPPLKMKMLQYSSLLVQLLTM